MKIPKRLSFVELSAIVGNIGLLTAVGLIVII